MVLIAISANAQAVIAEIDWSKEDAFNNWCSGENGSTAIVGAEGLEINVPAAGENFWNPQTVVLNIKGEKVAGNTSASAILEKGGTYQVIVTAKHPAGYLQVNLGSWDDGVSLQEDFYVEEATDFHEIVVDFSEGWPANCFSNVHVLWMSGKLPGLSVIKNVKIMRAPPTPYNPADICYNFISKGKVAEVISNPTQAYSGIVEIPATVIHEGEEYTVSKIADNAFDDCKGLYSVTVPNSVTTIGNYAFNGCCGLTSVTIPNSVTTIGRSAFGGCSGLTSVAIPNSVKVISNFAFYGCSGLTSVTIPNGVQSIGESAFMVCNSLTSVNIPNSVTSIGVSAFERCSGLTSVNIPNSVTTIGGAAFWGCSGLTSVTIPNSVTSIENSAFRNCYGLTSVTIPNSVTSIGDYAFGECSGLTSVIIPNSVTSIGGYAFNYCSSLTSVTIPNSVTFIGDNAFSYCSGLTSVTIPNSVRSIGFYVFRSCSKLKSVIIGNNVNSISSFAFAYCPELTDVYSYAENVPSTSANAFEGSYIEYATLHVPKGCLGAYKDVEPWKYFNNKVEMVDAKVKLSKTKATIEKGKTLTLKATITPSDLPDKSVTWTSSNTKVATVTSAGKVKGVKTGTATITCTSNSTGAKATCKVTVGSVKLNKTEATILKGKTTTLTATVYPSSLTDGSVTWESSNTAVATVTTAGKVKGVKVGTATITCTSNATGLKATCTVNVVKGFVTLNKTEACVQKGKTMTLKATVTLESLEDKSVTWESSDTKIATVTSDGKVKGVKYGTATITCTSVATGAKATCQVTVGKVVISISEVSIKKSRGITLEATVYPRDMTDNSVTWKSSDPSIATVNENGRVKGIKAGTATITCTSVATGLKGTCTVTVLSNSEARSMIGDDGELTGLKELESPAVEEPFDVYDLSGRKVLHQVTSLDGLPDGIYIVNGKKILKKK